MAGRAEDRSLALAAARAAAAVVRIHAADAAALSPEQKSDGDYVTSVDREAERAALTVLHAGSDIPVLAEESGGTAGERYWVVDPVDGTTNLLRGFPVVGVSVALMEERRPVAGAVVAPLLGAEWSAAEGEGAHDGAGHALSVTRHPGNGVVATGFPFKLRAETTRYLRVLERSLQRFEDLRRAGAASLDLAYAAQGTFEGFFELGLAVWDIAAGALLVREAGGVVTDWSGDAEAVFESGDIVAGEPAWHELMLSLVS
ncbi:MAG: inositol monophosphatase [Gammaproteobacteria bacterium]|nr:inositol monophosphatase [Gammaproteobacteria bacterium]